MLIEPIFKLKSIVYLKTDVEQKPRLVTAFLVDEALILYRVSCETVVSDHYDFELSNDKTVF